MPNTKNTATLQEEAQWFGKILHNRMKTYSNNEEELPQPIPPDLSGNDSPYACIVKREELSREERLILMLALMPTLAQRSLDVFLLTNGNIEKPYTEFGGRTGGTGKGFIPTIETAIFLLAGNDFAKRIAASMFFDPQENSPLLKMLDIQPGPHGEPLHNNVLTVKKSWYSQLVAGKPYHPRFSSEFPAQRLETKLTWEDLILNDRTQYQVEEILCWMEHNSSITNDWKLYKQIKPGYRALFYGPPGTGKTLTASLLGEKMGKDVYRVDLSQVVSKYIGETEKNMAGIFDQAEDKNWILFFDEADALFGKRVNASNANDQHSNQRVSYLLQRIENYPGVIILASNFRGNMDKAFARRFQSIIHFPSPEEDARLKLWETTIPEKLPLDTDDVDIKNLARKYKVTGGMIVNIVHYAVLACQRDKLDKIPSSYLFDGISRELAKVGK